VTVTPAARAGAVPATVAVAATSESDVRKGLVLCQ
jgi:hypothetical protein